MAHETGRDRRGSASSVESTVTKRKRVDKNYETEDVFHTLRMDLEEIIFNESNKINKMVASKILANYAKIEKEVINMRLKIAHLEGQLDTKPTTKESMSYVSAAKKLIPRFGKKEVATKSIDNTVLVYPADSDKEDSTETKKELKKIIEPKEEGWQIKTVRKIRKGGLVVEAGSKKTAEKIKEVVKAAASIKYKDPVKKKPKIQVFGVDEELKEGEIIQCVYNQNLKEAGFEEKKIKENMKCRYKTNKKDSDSCNWIIECSADIRDELISRGRIYIDFSYCRVVDYLGVARCFKCQCYGHVAKHCDKKNNTCSHCGEEGHVYTDCKNKDKETSCAACKAAKKPDKHRGATKDCPIYVRFVQRNVAMTKYNE